MFKKKSFSMMGVTLLVIVVIVFMMCAFQVRFTETAVVTRFDKIRTVIKPEEAGLHGKLPWPIDRVHRYDARLRSFETEFRQLGTRDQNTIVLTAYATWRIADARTFLTALSREDAAGPKIRDLLENRVSVVLRSHPLEDLVNVNEEDTKFREIEAAFLAGIKDTAADKYGIEIVSVGIKRLGIPSSVTTEVFARMKEDRQKTIKRLVAEGDAEARKIRADAKEVSEKILARARAYAKTIEARGVAEAAKYYAVFEENRELSDFLKKIETVRRIFQAGQITLVMEAQEMVPFDALMREGNSTNAKGSRDRDVTGERGLGEAAGQADGSGGPGKEPPDDGNETAEPAKTVTQAEKDRAGIDQ